MTDIKTPAIFLSFDDWHEREWADYLPTLAEHNVKETFYSCIRRNNIDAPMMETQAEVARVQTPAYWEALHALADAGHTVGFHTVNHAIMDVKTVEFWPLITKEITRGLAWFESEDLLPRHFSYPGGKHNPQIDAALLDHFDTLRTIVPPDDLGAMKYYTPTQVVTERVFTAYDLRYPGCFNAVDRVLATGLVGFFFAHNPVDYAVELAELFRRAEASGATFYPMSVLEGR